MSSRALFICGRSVYCERISHAKRQQSPCQEAFWLIAAEFPTIEAMIHHFSSMLSFFNHFSLIAIIFHAFDARRMPLHGSVLQ
jgi:hypothetical protein